MLQNTEKTQLLFLGFRTYQKQGSENVLFFVEVADATNFQKFEFMANPELAPTITSFPKHTPINLEFSMSTYQNRPSLRLEKLEAKQHQKN